jgi:hypothetical protein
MNLTRCATLFFIAVTSLITGCGGSTSLSGTLSSLQSFALNNPLTKLHKLSTTRGMKLQSGAASTITCITASNPPTKVSGTVSSTGAFKIDLSSVLNQPLTCSVLDASDAILGTFLFQNSSKKGFGGGTQQVDTISLSAGVDVGTVSISGSQIAVDAGALGLSTTGAAVTAATAFDPTGVWTVSNVDFTMAPGYSNLCTAGDNTCHGPTAGDSIYVRRVVGKSFTPDSTCQAAVADNSYSGGTCGGTTGTDDNFAFSIWMSKTTFLSCGDSTTGAIGFTESQAKAYGNIDLSSDTSTLHQAFAWSTTGPSASTITDGWQSSAATANWDIKDCNPVTIDGKTVYKCLDGSGHFSLSYGGGCTDASGSNVQPDSWNHVDFAGGSCTQSNTTLGSYTLSENACTVTYTPTSGSPQTLHCGGAFGTFNVAGNSVYVGSVTPTSVVSSGAACSSIVVGGNDSKALNKLQCYANYFNNTLQNAARSTPTYCLRDLRTNWGATTSADFITSDGPGRPVNQALTEKVTYLSENVAALTQMQDQYRGIQVTGKNGDSWMPCHTKEKNSITMTKVDSTHLLVKFITETHLADSSTACQAAASDTTSSAYSQLGLGVSRMLFKMTQTGT